MERHTTQKKILRDRLVQFWLQVQGRKDIREQDDLGEEFRWGVGGWGGWCVGGGGGGGGGEWGVVGLGVEKSERLGPSTSLI